MIRAICIISGNRIKVDWVWPPFMQVIFNSEQNYKNALEKDVPVYNPVVIHSGIKLENFSFKPRTALNEPLCIFVPGRIEPNKGQKDAVSLLSKLAAAGIDAKLVFAGHPWSEKYFSISRRK